MIYRTKPGVNVLITTRLDGQASPCLSCLPSFHRTFARYHFPFGSSGPNIQFDEGHPGPTRTLRLDSSHLGFSLKVKLESETEKKCFSARGESNAHYFFFNHTNKTLLERTDSDGAGSSLLIGIHSMIGDRHKILDLQS